jgi:predicted SnoaL-like aldol condensation-catalyzing enzyme
MKSASMWTAASLVLVLLSPASALAQAADSVAEANKKTVLAFYDAALVRMDIDAARQFLGPSYIQHNPTAPDGAEGLAGLLKFLKERFPQRSASIKRVIAEGDLVVLHVHSRASPDDRGTAIVDIFRLDKGKIVEHWDVMQAVPETARNNNTMF